MTPSSVCFEFLLLVPMPEVQATLRLALFAVESLYGEDRVRLEIKTRLDADVRTLVIDSVSEVGRTLAVVFTGFIRREFGDDAIRMSHDGRGGGVRTEGVVP